MAEPGGAKSKAKKKRERQKARKKEKQVAQKTAGGCAALQEKLAFSEPEPEPESEPKPEPQELLPKLTSEAPLGPMFEFGTAEVLQWLESVEGLTGKQRAAIKDRLEEDVYIGQDLLETTERSVLRLLRGSDKAEATALQATGQL